jgi:hypothetical protein
MFRALCLSLLVLAGFPGLAQDTSETEPAEASQVILPGEESDLTEFKWIKRPLVVFADSPNDPRYIQQMDFITQRLEYLRERDVVVVTDTSPEQRSPIRQRMRPRGFQVVLVDKDGDVFQRKPLPISVRELSRLIDKLPMRQQEIRDGGGAS